MYRSSISIIFVLILAACSNKQLYQVGQDYKKSECNKKATTQEQHIACSQAEKKLFKEYKKERQEILKR